MSGRFHLRDSACSFSSKGPIDLQTMNPTPPNRLSSLAADEALWTSRRGLVLVATRRCGLRFFFPPAPAKPLLFLAVPVRILDGSRILGRGSIFLSESCATAGDAYPYYRRWFQCSCWLQWSGLRRRTLLYWQSRVLCPSTRTCRERSRAFAGGGDDGHLLCIEICLGHPCPALALPETGRLISWRQ